MDPRNHPEQVSLSPVNHTVDGRIGGSTRLPDDALHTNGEQTTVAFVKGGKRKRLSKACDACHKSKRRCDGTAPCSNCYFASKSCTYTDSSGRPVPAPRNSNHDNANASVPEIPARDQISRPGEPSPPHPPLSTDEEYIAAPKRNRSNPTAGTASQLSPTLHKVQQPQSKLLDRDTTHELVNLFFAHCNPHRMIFHKPSFSAELSHNRLPEYLVLVVCAVAAPLSKSVSSTASIARLAGVPFYEEAVSIMFDNAGRLLSEPCLATAQALCLMEMHEVAASHSWTKHYKYFDLALRVLEESLEVHVPDDKARRPASPTPPDSLDMYIERECSRRCFWLIQLMGWINAIYTYRPLRPRCVEMMATVRLPIDETTFDLAVHWHSATSEFIHAPAPRTRYASQFGHVLRILSLYSTVQAVVAMDESTVREAALRDCRKDLEEWDASLSGHLRFSEDNLEKQVSMFDTSSNTGAWCFCFMHALYPCSCLALAEGEGRLAEPVPWVRKQLGMIFDATGTRAKNTILSACVLWSYSKYHPDDPQLHIWDHDFEKTWGFSVTVVAHQWREVQAKERAANSPKNSPPQREQATEPAANSASVVNAAERHPVDLGEQPHGDAAVVQRYDFIPQGQYQRTVDTTAAEQIVQAPLLRPHRDPAPNLPSLKASGLLDARPPSEAFANGLTISSQPPLHRDDDRRSMATLLNSPVQLRGNMASAPWA